MSALSGLTSVPREIVCVCLCVCVCVSVEWGWMVQTVTSSGLMDQEIRYN
jgi:hypothetical protein